jgi:hypothetical protein
MKKHFVTLFDKNFLTHGLVLKASLKKNLPESILWVICMDSTTFDVLSAMNLQDLNLIKLEDVENAKLLSVKSQRSAGEYCWTLTPFSADFVFSKDSQIEEVTYIDADLYILNKNINLIFEEFDKSKKSALITKHAYSPEYDQSAIAGIFCVQFMIFKRDLSRHVRQSWQDQCIEWCFGRYEDGKFGDQKYLDDWPEKFASDIHVLERESLLLGPWNCTRFPYSDGAAWHFHGLRIQKDENTKQLSLVNNGMYKIPEPTIRNVYNPYIEELNLTIKQLAAVGFTL